MYCLLSTNFFYTKNFPNYGKIHTCTCTCMYLYDQLYWQCLPYTGWFWRWQDRRFAVEFLWQRRWWGGFDMEEAEDVSYSTTKHCFVVWQFNAMGWSERNEHLLYSVRVSMYMYICLKTHSTYRKRTNFHGHNISCVKFLWGLIFVGQSSQP